MQQMNRIKSALQNENYDEAAKIFFRLIKDSPDEPLHYINFANLLLELNQLDQAKHFYDIAIEKDATSATAIYGIAQFHYKKGQFVQAASKFQQAISLGLEHSDNYYMLGLSFIQQNHFKMALPYLLRAIELDETVEKLFQYGLALAQAQHIKEAKAILQKVVEKDSKHADAMYNLGIIAFHEDDLKWAEELITRALSIQPDHLLAKRASRILQGE